MLDPTHEGVLLMINVFFSFFLINVDSSTEWKSELNHFIIVFVFCVLINFLFFVELIANILVCGCKNAMKDKPFLVLEIGIQVFTLIFMILYFDPHSEFSKTNMLTELALMFALRDFRIYFFLRELESMQIIF